MTDALRQAPAQQARTFAEIWAAFADLKQALGLPIEDGYPGTDHIPPPIQSATPGTPPSSGRRTHRFRMAICARQAGRIMIHAARGTCGDLARCTSRTAHRNSPAAGSGFPRPGSSRSAGRPRHGRLRCRYAAGLHPAGPRGPARQHMAAAGRQDVRPITHARRHVQTADHVAPDTAPLLQGLTWVPASATSTTTDPHGAPPHHARQQHT